MENWSPHRHASPTQLLRRLSPFLNPHAGNDARMTRARDVQVLLAAPPPRLGFSGFLLREAAGGASSVPVLPLGCPLLSRFCAPRLRCLGTTTEELVPTPGGRAVELDELDPLRLLLALVAAPDDDSSLGGGC